MTTRCLTAILLAVALAVPAPAAKWEAGCPKVRTKLIRVGRSLGGGAPYALSRYYEHVGHELTFHLRENDVLRYGGFSTEPDGNTLEVTFTPIEGTPIPLPPVPVTATSPAALTVVVPDSRPAIGRLLVGHAEMVVKRGEQPMFVASRQLILPPMNDVRDMEIDGYEVEALAAMDKSARLWIPLSFRDYGTGNPGLPECPTELTPITPFAVEFSLKKGEDQALPYLSFGGLKNNKLFFGDYLLFGENMYGNKILSKLDVSPIPERGIVMCSKNDALELVVLVGLKNPALGKKSELLELVREARPINVKIHNISVEPDVAEVLASVDYDATKRPCYPAP